MTEPLPPEITHAKSASSAPFWARAVATWFWSGQSPVAPGTAGSLAALPFAWAIVHFGGWPALAAGAVLATAIGTVATARIIESDGVKDPGYVVIDEVAGQWIALLPAALDPMLWLVGFAAFRLFDIWKPWPVGWADRNVEGAWGVMLDDLIAGGYAALAVFAASHWISGT